MTRDIAEKIVDGRSDYLIALKGNQSKLHADVQKSLDEVINSKVKDVLAFKTSEEGHGREELRRYFVMNAPDKLQFDHDWPGLTSIGMVQSTRIVNGSASYEDRAAVPSDV